MPVGREKQDEILTYFQNKTSFTRHGLGKFTTRDFPMPSLEEPHVPLSAATFIEQIMRDCRHKREEKQNTNMEYEQEEEEEVATRIRTQTTIKDKIEEEEPFLCSLTALSFSRKDAVPLEGEHGHSGEGVQAGENVREGAESGGSSGWMKG